MPVVLAARSSDTLWTSRRELERMFGPTSVARWADVESTANARTIADNVQAAVEDATDEAKARLRGGACGEVQVASRTLRRMTTRLAAGLLYEARGVHDTSDEDGRHRLKYSLDRADKWFRRVLAGQIELDGVTQPTSFPFVSPHLVRHGGFSGPQMTPEEVQYANEREEIYGIPTYQWFWGDGFDQFFTPF